MAMIIGLPQLSPKHGSSASKMSLDAWMSLSGLFLRLRPPQFVKILEFSFVNKSFGFSVKFLFVAEIYATC